MGVRAGLEVERDACPDADVGAHNLKLVGSAADQGEDVPAYGVWVERRK
jgi:hypothetical protein